MKTMIANRLRIFLTLMLAMATVGCGESFPKPAIASGTKPERFRVLLFPRQSRLVDTNGNMHSIERAIPVRLPEALSDTVEVYIADGKANFNRTDFACIPPDAQGEQLVSRLNANLAADPAPETYQSVSFSISADAVCSYKIRAKSGRPTIFEYTVDENDVPIPKTR